MADKFKPCNILRRGRQRAKWSLPDMDEVLNKLLPYEDTKRYSMVEQVNAHIQSLNYAIFEGYLYGLNVVIAKRGNVSEEGDRESREEAKKKTKKHKCEQQSSIRQNQGGCMPKYDNSPEKAECDVAAAVVKLPVAKSGYKYDAFYIHAGRKIVVYDDFSRDTVKLANLILHELIHAAIAILCGWSCRHVGPFKVWQKYIMETLCPNTWVKLD